MMHFLRSQSQAVLIFILIVIGASFLLFSSAGTNLITDLIKPHADYGEINGHELSAADLVGALRNTRNLIILNKGPEALNDPSVRQNLATEAWRDLLLQSEADKLHIQVSDDEVIKYIQTFPPLQQNGVYHPELFQQMMNGLTTNFGITPPVFEDLIRSSLRTQAAFAALFSGVHATPPYLTQVYQNYYGPVSLSLISFDLDTYTAAAQVTPEQIQKEYEANPLTAEYRTAEKRKVDYVLFQLSPEQLHLADKDKNAAKEALGQKALNFALSFQPDPSATNASVQALDFPTAAKQLGLEVKTTDAFTPDTSPAGLPASPSFNNAAFSLTKDDPISRVVEMEDGFAILHLDEIVPSELRPLSEVQPILEKKIKQSEGRIQLEQAAQQADLDLQQALAKGIDFKTAAYSLHLTVQEIPVFTPASEDTRKNPLFSALSYPATTLQVGETSHLLPLSEVRLAILHLNQRTPADPALQDKFVQNFGPKREDQLRTTVSLDWEHWRDRQHGTHPPKDLQSLNSF